MAVSVGRYHFGGWRVAGSDDGPGRLASIHEAWHDRLQFTTMYGLVVQHFWAMAEATGDAKWSTRGDDLVLGCVRAHEEFASIMTELMSRDLRDSLRSEYPIYARHADRARTRAGTGVNEFELLHRVNAIYRACMQPDGLVRHEPVGAIMDQLSAATATRQTRPDFRLEALAGQLRTAGWPAEETRHGDNPVVPSRADSDVLSADQPDRQHRNDRPRVLADPAAADAHGTDSIQDYANQNDLDWETDSQNRYNWCRRLLERSGCPTLAYNGHLDLVRVLNEEATSAAGQPIRLTLTAPNEGRESDVDVVLRSFEAETLAFEPPPKVERIGDEVGLREVASGSGDRTHIFLAIRPTSRSLDSTGDFGIAPRTANQSALVRSTHRRDGETIVMVRPCSALELEQAADHGLPVIVSVSMMSLSHPEIRGEWAAYLGGDTTTVLLDLSPTQHVREWLNEARASIRYGLGEYQFDEHRAVALGLVVTMGERTSRLHLGVVTRSFAAAFEVWIKESPDLAVRVTRDDALLDEREELVSITMGHLLAEEPYFDFKAAVAEVDQ